VRERLDFIEHHNLALGLFSNFRPDFGKPPIDLQIIKEKISYHLRQMTLMVTNDCNLRCRYCVYSGIYKGRNQLADKFMDFDLAKKAIDYLIAHSQGQGKDQVALAFYGGEPFLNFRLIKRCVEYINAVKEGVVFTATTNGTIINKEMIEFLTHNNFLLLVSLDGPRDIHDANRVFKNGQRGTFSRIIRNLERIREYNPNYFNSHVQLCVTLVPPIDYVSLDTFFSSLGLFCRVNFVEIFGSPYFDNLTPSELQPKGFKNLADKFTHGATENIYGNIRDNPDYMFVYGLFDPSIRRLHNRVICNLGKHQPRFGLCVPGADRSFVDLNGKFYPCEKTDGNKNLCMGNTEGGVDFNRVHSLIESFWTMQQQGNCSDCPWVRICEMCIAHVVYNHRYDDKKRKYVCISLQSHYPDVMKLYCSILERNKQAFDYIERH
jgi:uncharacterized protein